MRRKPLKRIVWRLEALSSEYDDVGIYSIVRQAITSNA